MSKLNYRPDAEVMLRAIESTFDRFNVSDTKVALLGNNVPANFVELVQKTGSFKDAFLNHIVTSTDPFEQTRVLDTLVLGVQGTEGESVAAYAECVAAIAYATGNTTLAMEAISRVNPRTASSFIKSTATALSKDMPADVYKRMLVNSTESSNTVWETVEKPARYPGR